MRLTESQARTAVRKWLFEASYSPEQGSYRTEFTLDNKAGTLGDNRNGEMDLSKPVPIIAAPQMPSQLSVDMPPIEDPEWTPVSADEVARAAHQLSSTIPDEQAEWFYSELQELIEKTLERNKPELAATLLDQNTELKAMVNPKRVKQEPTQESILRNLVRSILLEGSDEDERGRYLDTDDIDDFAQEFADEEGMDISDVYTGGDVLRRRNQKENKPESALDLRDNEEASLRQIQATAVLPNISTLSGLRKYISNTIHPVIEIWVTANNLSKLMTSFIKSSKGLYLFFDAIGTSSMGKDALFTPDEVLELKGLEYVADAIMQAMQENKERIGKKFKYQLATNPQLVKSYVAKYGPYVLHTEQDGGIVDLQGLYEDYEAEKPRNRLVLMKSSMYTQIMAKIVVEPIIRKWTEAKKQGRIEMSRNNQQQLSYSEAGQWLDEAVSIWESKSNGRKKRAVRDAMMGLLEFRDAQQLAASQGKKLGRS